MKASCTAIACFFLFFQINSTITGQTPQSITIPLAANIGGSPTAVTLSWPNPAPANQTIWRRTKGQAGNQWMQLKSVQADTTDSFTDTTVTTGLTYEYALIRGTSPGAYGYAHVAVDAPENHSRGKVLLFVDADLLAPLSGELNRLRGDLAGDGWQVIEHIADTAATVQSIKSQIVADYFADPENVKSVFLLGKIPVPYSGNTNWDGHPDHQGAWPCDAYYADVNGNWTDFTINNTSPARPANDNIPGDGKFDQSYLPSPVELQVGRVDFRRLTPGTFGATTVALIKRYLDKNHNWRTGAYTVDTKALVDDNFGYFNGESFASNGYRNAYPLVGADNVVAADFFDGTEQQGYLMGYGCGGGTYTSAGGVGNSSDFATDSVNIVFANLFGSYHGDWDYETNPFMPAALASRGGILTCSWAGRPHQFYQALASGETIGYCVKETQNAAYNSQYYNSLGKGGAHTTLLGDPTLRAHVVPPPSNVTAAATCTSVLLYWSAASDVVGYHVYRSTEQYGVYTRLNTGVITDTFFPDTGPVTGTLYYQVRAIRQQTSPGGGIYANTSTGAMTSVLFMPDLPDISLPPIPQINCDMPCVTIQATSSTPGVAIEQVVACNPGFYQVFALNPANGCFSVLDFEVQEAPPIDIDATITDASGPGASDGSILLEVMGGTPPYAYTWNTGATTPQLDNLPYDTFTVTVTDQAGCTAELTLQVNITIGTDEETWPGQVVLSPNPTGGISMLSVTRSRATPLYLALRNATGRLILEMHLGSSADHSIPLDMSHQPPGAYFVTLITDNQSLTVLLTLVR
jgi:hypothetical protein